MSDTIPKHRTGGQPPVVAKSVTMEELVKDPGAMYRQDDEEEAAEPVKAAARPTARTPGRTVTNSDD